MRAGGPTFASFIVTFDRPQALRGTIAAMLEQTRVPDLLLVVDNGTNPETVEVVRQFADERLVYQSTGENLGSAGGVSFGMQWLFDKGYDWIHSVDDDDPPRTEDTVEKLLALIARNDDGRLGAVAAVGSHWNWRTGEYERIPDDELLGDLCVDTIGGNGHLTVRRDVIADIGPPDRQLFFGFYDPLYCLRIGQAGYRLMVDGDLLRRFRTHAGRIGYTRERAWRPRDPYHAIWRRYYVSRNYIYRMTRTFERPDLARREARKAIVRALAAWGRGPRYGGRFTVLQLRGVVDGYRGRLGRTVEPVAKPAPAG